MRKQRNAPSIGKLIISILICEVIGFTSGLNSSYCDFKDDIFAQC
jgi:hypothetical protein